MHVLCLSFHARDLETKFLNSEKHQLETCRLNDQQELEEHTETRSETFATFFGSHKLCNEVLQ